MSARDYALDRAVQIVASDPKTAFDLVLAADKAAAKDPRITALNRSLRKTKTEAVKFLNRTLSGLVWSAGETYDYIGLGSQFRLLGSAEASGPTSPIAAQIHITIITIPAHENPEPDQYNLRVEAKGKGGRNILGDSYRSIRLDDIKDKAGTWLKKVTDALKNHLEGSLDLEKQALLEYANKGVDDLEEALKEAKALKAQVEASKNLVADAASLRRAIPFVSDPYSGMRSKLDEISRAGG